MGVQAIHNLWWNIPGWGVSIGTSPKAALSSIRDTLLPLGIERAEYPGIIPAIWIVRHPIDRFMSLFHDKVARRGPLKDGHKAIIDGMSPKQLFQYITRPNNDNHHWTPQAKLAGDNYTHLLPIEYLAAWWKSQGHVKLLARNVSGLETEISQELEQDILDHYSDDVLLYQLAHRSSLITALRTKHR